MQVPLREQSPQGPAGLVVVSPWSLWCTVCVKITCRFDGHPGTATDSQVLLYSAGTQQGRSGTLASSLTWAQVF